jgi:hypothetical protein
MSRTKPTIPDPRDQEDAFCYYCQRQYACLGQFKRHILREHGLGLARRLNLLTQQEEDDRAAQVQAEGQVVDRPDPHLSPFVPYDPGPWEWRNQWSKARR